MVFRCLLLAAFGLGTSLPAGLGLAQVNRAKAATVLIEGRLGESFGTGFCVSDDGYVVTNCHVVDGAPKDVRVVLHPGDAEQQVVQGQVVSQNRETDLALVRLTGVKGRLVAVELGSTEKLFETAPLTAFGYPFGRVLAVTKGAYPSVSVNTGKVTSLRRVADGTLREIQMDVLVNPGNSGGPVLDGSGKVVGVTVSGIPGSGVNFAIPVDHVRALLAIPEVTVTPVAEVDWQQRFAPVSLQIRARSLLPPKGKLVCRAVLVSSSLLRPMEVKEEVSGSEWTATAPLLASPAPDAPVRVQIDVANTVISTSIPNRVIGCSHTPLPSPQRWNLSELDELVPGMSVKCQGGFGIDEEGLEITGLAPLVVRVCGQDLTIPLQELKRLRVLDKEQVVRTVDYRVSITLDGQDWATSTGTIAIHSSPWHVATGMQPFADLGKGAAPTVPPPPTQAGTAPFPTLLPGAVMEEVSEVKLPARYTDCIRAGSGRYLVLPMPSLKKAAVIDLAERSITGYVPLADAGALVAGGRQWILVANSTSGLLDRWTINPLKRDRRVTLPVTDKLYGLAMGAGSDGPLLMIHEMGSRIVWRFVDGESLAPMELSVARSGGYSHDYPPNVRVADCGTVFGVWVTGLSPSGLDVHTLFDGKFTYRNERKSVGHVLPGPNGEFLYTGSCGIFASDLVQAPDSPSDLKCVIPSSHPAYYLGLTMPGPDYMRGGDTRIALFVRGLASPVLTLPANQDIAAANVAIDRDGLAFEKRYNLVPQLRLLAILPSTNDCVRIHTIDIEQMLRERQVDFLFVESVPPAWVQKGATFRYQVVARTSAKTIAYKLDSGPQGMAISPGGELTWDVPETADAVGGVIVSLETDDGQNRFHAFNLKIVP